MQFSWLSRIQNLDDDPVISSWRSEIYEEHRVIADGTVKMGNVKL
jgi:hypothetical protein